MLDRRRFLVLVGSAAVTAAVAPRWADAARLPWHSARVVPGSLPDALPHEPIEAARALIGAAILAPSFWNAQPWRFEVDGPELRLVLDAARALPENDPDQRFAQLSLGASLENLLIAARAWGQQPTVQYLPWGPVPRAGAQLVAARVTWQPSEVRRDRDLFGALRARRSNPRHYDGRQITMQDRAQLLAQVPDEMRMHWLEDRGDVRAVAQIVHDATLARAHDARAQAECCRWLRSSDEDARKHCDGMTPDELCLSGTLGWLAAHELAPGSRLHGWAVGYWAREQGDLVRSSGALALLTVPRQQGAAAIAAGQAYERFALRATALGLAQQPLSAAIESEHHRALLARQFGASGEEPLLLVRLGHAHPAPATPRRSVALVSTYRTS